MLEKIHHKSAPKEIVNALVTLYHQGKFDDVLSRSSQLIKEYPHTFVLHNIMGAISFEKGHTEAAIEHFRQVIELRPHHPHAYNNLGAALIDIREYQEAKSNLEKAIELQPDYAEAYNNLGNVYKEMEDYTQAISVYEKAIELNPQYYEAYNNLGVALGQNKQYEEAEKVLKNVIKLEPAFVEPLNSLGSILTCMEKYEEAKTILNRSIEINSNNEEAFYNLGLIYSKNNNFKDSILNFQNALKFGFDKPEIYYNQAINYINLEVSKEATKNLKKCIDLDPKNQKALHLYNSLIGHNTKSAPKDYVIDLFDNYAKNFEQSLIDKLDYKIPQEIRNLIKTKLPKSLGSILDLGCGTGLVGFELRKYCTYLKGIDLSRSMIQLSREKKIYDELEEIDISAYLKKENLNFDYFIAADVFIYVGDLNNIFQFIKKRNNKQGYLVFSTEHFEGYGYKLEKSGRYSHSKDYIVSLCKEFGFTIKNFKKIPLRKENNQYISGALYNLKFLK